MNRQTVEQYLIDLECRDAARRVREHRPLGWSDYLRKARDACAKCGGSHANRNCPWFHRFGSLAARIMESELMTVASMLALTIVAALIFWYGSPVPSVEAHIHQIVENVVSR